MFSAEVHRATSPAINARSFTSAPGAAISSEMSLARSCTARSISANGDAAAPPIFRPQPHPQHATTERMYPRTHLRW
jgi:hypothetical protein